MQKTSNKGVIFLNGEKIFYCLCGLLISATAISLLVEQKLQINILVYLLVICISIGLCLASKLILNEEMTRISYLVVNILLVNGLIKLMVVGYGIFNKMKYLDHHNLYEDSANHLLVVNILQISSLCMIIWLLSGKAKHYLILWNGVNILCIGLLMGLTQYKVRCSQSIYVMVKCTYALGMCVILGVTKWWRKQVPKEDVYFYKLFVFGCIVREVLGCIENLKNLDFNMTIALLLLLQWILVFIYCYLKCAINPWKDKKKLLVEAGDDMAFEQEQSEHIVSLSHELKTPVNVIRSAIDLILLDEKLEGNIREQLTCLKASCHEIMNIIQNMIDIQKIEAAHIKCNLQVCNLVEVIENVLEAFSSERKIKFEFNPLEEELFQQVDIQLIQQGFMLLISLLINRPGDEPFYIEMRKESAENEGTILTIQHEGVAFLEKISYELDTLSVIHADELEHLTLQLIELIFNKQEITMEYILENNQKILQLRFPICNNQTQEWLDQENIELLKEKIKGRGLV